MSSTADLAKHFLEAVDQAAIASSAWRGKGDKNAADDAAVEAMRRTFDAVPFDGRVALVKVNAMKHPCCSLANNLEVQSVLKAFLASILLLIHWNAPTIVLTISPTRSLFLQQHQEEHCFTHLIVT